MTLDVSDVRLLRANSGHSPTVCGTGEIDPKLSSVARRARLLGAHNRTIVLKSLTCRSSVWECSNAGRGIDHWLLAHFDEAGGGSIEIENQE
jgi:hypothetical protein